MDHSTGIEYWNGILESKLCIAFCGALFSALSSVNDWLFCLLSFFLIFGFPWYLLTAVYVSNTLSLPEHCHFSFKCC